MIDGLVGEQGVGVQKKSACNGAPPAGRRCHHRDLHTPGARTAEAACSLDTSSLGITGGTTVSADNFYYFTVSLWLQTPHQKQHLDNFSIKHFQADMRISTDLRSVEWLYLWSFCRTAKKLGGRRQHVATSVTDSLASTLKFSCTKYAWKCMYIYRVPCDYIRFAIDGRWRNSNRVMAATGSQSGSKLCCDKCR